ncbi:MAG: hypothetical protein LBF97_04560 [Elusimicrobiota bacterium]|jgi:hypothetical protein|nr:hypothetical protein [Elusimicrobiota bacterium]
MEKIGKEELKIKNKYNKDKYIGSDCKYCYLDEGAFSLVYFCKYYIGSNKGRVLCNDGFTRTCKNYKSEK